VSAPLFPLPIADHPCPLQGTPFRVAQGEIDIYGYHAPYCSSELNESGAAAAEHGPVCSRYVSVVDGVRPDQSRAAVTVEITRAYHHGTYELPLERDRNQFVRLCTDADTVAHEAGDYLAGIYLHPGDARSLAAALTRAADQLEFGPRH